MIQFPIWGDYEGAYPFRKRFYAQTSCVDVTTLKRFFCLVFKRGTATPPSGDGLYIGLVDLATLNDPDKFDPATGRLKAEWINSWWWAGYLADVTESNTYYYISSDINANYPTTQPLYLIMATNYQYANGWSAGGYGAEVTGLPLWRFSVNEPTQPDGWVIFDGFSLGFVPYTLGGWPLIEGFCQISEPNFPGTVYEGDPYNFDLIIDQLAAFPCGCPETVVWQIFDRDTNQPIHDPVTYLLDCGYTGVTFNGTITFTGGGIFYGQLKVGHKINGQWQVDDIYDFSVVVVPYPCSHWTNSTDCEAHPCWWWNGSCHDDQPTLCSQLNNQSDCERWGCYWYDGSCHSSPPCSYYTDKTTCESHNCWWWNGSCHDDQPTQCSQLDNQPDCTRWGCLWWNSACHGYGPSTCEELNNQTDCELYSCYWYDGSCHSSPYQPEICDWIDAQGGPTSLDIADVFVIIDSYIYSTPPTGYTFIPTIVNVFGVIDYYLGFDGDAKTGCDYY